MVMPFFLCFQYQHFRIGHCFSLILVSIRKIRRYCYHRRYVIDYSIYLTQDTND